MKHFIIPLIVLVLLLTPTAALAADGDGMEVDIDIITGGDAGVDVDIDAGGDVSLLINGEIPRFGTAGSGTSPMGVRRLVKNVMAPYLNDIWQGIYSNSEGLVKLIQIVGNDHTHELAEHETDIYNQSVELGTHLGRIEGLEDMDEYVLGRLSSLDENIGDGDAELQERLAQLEDEYNKRLTVIILSFSAAFALLAIALVILWKRRR